MLGFLPAPPIMQIDPKAVTRFEKAQDRLVLQAADLSLETVAAMVEQGAIDVKPGYQRRERWSHERQAALIESFLLNIPVPPVYLAEDDFGTYSVIDGKQRLTAIAGFMRDKWALVALETFREVEGAKFSDLPRPLQNALQVRPYIRAVTLLKQSDPELKYEVFTRLNTGGEPLLPQEIRNVLYRGPLNDLVFKLAEDEFLRRQLKISSEKSSGYKAMQDAEMVLRFLTLKESWRNFSGDYRRSMDSFMERHQKDAPSKLKRHRADFEDALKASEVVFGEHAFKRPEGSNWRDQFLAGMYDAQMVAMSLLSTAKLDRLKKHRTAALTGIRQLFADSTFEVAVRQATNTPGRVRHRIQAVADMLRDLAG
jgi:hypothetical protein